MNNTKIDDSYYLLKAVSSNKYSSQRSLAKSLNYSLGKINFLIRALTHKGIVKIENFYNNSDKSGYVYCLTPYGISQKIVITKKFLKRKQKEYDRLKMEIEQIQKEI